MCLQTSYIIYIYDLCATTLTPFKKFVNVEREMCRIRYTSNHTHTPQSVNRIVSSARRKLLNNVSLIVCHILQTLQSLLLQCTKQIRMHA